MSLEAAELGFAYGGRRPRAQGPGPGGQGPWVIDGVSLTIGAGALVGILGPNGSGKTTLLRLLAGALRPQAGAVRLDGMDVASVPRRAIARRLAVVPQETELAFDYSALEIVLMGRYPHLGAFEIEGPADLAAAFAALEATGTHDLADRPFRTLSGGEKQRVIIASALAQLDRRPRTRAHPSTGPEVPRAGVEGQGPSCVLLLDEPTASLDLHYQLEVATLLRRLHQERDVAIVLSTHDLRFASSVCSEMVLLSKGRLIAAGPPRDVLTPTKIAELYGIDARVAGTLDLAPRTAQLAPSAPRTEHPAPSTRTEHRAPGTQHVSALLLFFSLLIVAIVAMPFVGSTPLAIDRIFSRALPFADNVDAQIFFVARLPRTLAAALVGGTLAAAGVVFQGLLRNPLATPYTLGVSAGASLGAMLAITFGRSLPTGSVASASLVGSLVAVAVVYALARARHRGLSTTVLLLAGVTLNAFFSALILFVQYLSNFAETYRALRWLMGDLDISGYGPLVAALPLVAIAFVAFAWLARPLNLLSLGADAAGTRGLAVDRAQRVAFVGASLATGAAVSVGGPIGFVGIIVPHLVRLIVGADHRVVLPASTFFGAAFLILCDALARTMFAPLELPVGIITAVIGGPFFLWLLLRHR